VPGVWNSAGGDERVSCFLDVNWGWVVRGTPCLDESFGELDREDLDWLETGLWEPVWGVTSMTRRTMILSGA